jgi:hypothetical protein
MRENDKIALVFIKFRKNAQCAVGMTVGFCP